MIRQIEEADTKGERKMNKKQWYALGFLFFVYAIAFMFLPKLFVGDYFYTARTITPSIISLAIIDGIMMVLVLVCYMVSIACLVCGWLEKGGVE